MVWTEVECVWVVADPANEAPCVVDLISGFGGLWLAGDSS